jgi:hypothetical protein
MKANLVGDLAREAHLVRDDDHRHAVDGELPHHVQHLPTSSGSSADVGSSKSISLGSMARARAMATRCCCPPESCAG